MTETVHEEIRRLQREIGERQMRLQFLLLGGPMQSVTILSGKNPRSVPDWEQAMVLPQKK